MSLDVDPVTFLLSRLFTSAAFVGCGAAVALVAGDKLGLSKRPLWALMGLVGFGSGLASFLAEWASLKLSLCVGLGAMVLGASLAFEKGAVQGALRRAGAIALFAAGAGWVGWNIHLVFR